VSRIKRTERLKQLDLRTVYNGVGSAGESAITVLVVQNVQQVFPEPSSCF